MTGKEKCNLLRQIRREIAQANDIIFLTRECDYPGDNCLGTCPICDAEIRWLDGELNRKAALGEKITVAGISLDSYRQCVPDRGFQDHWDPGFSGKNWDSHRPETPGIMISQEEKWQWPLVRLDLPVPLLNWLYQENIRTVSQLHDILQFDRERLRSRSEEWYQAALQAMDRQGIPVLDDILMGDMHVETGLVEEVSLDDEFCL